MQEFRPDMKCHVVTSKYLGGGRVGDPLEVDPVSRLLVFRIVDLLRWVDRWLEVGEQATSLGLSIVDSDRVGVVGTECMSQDAD